MNPILSTGVLIGVALAAWTFVMGMTGWYKDPRMMSAFFLVIPIEVACLVWGLRRTAAEGRGYGSQIVAGTMMAIVGRVIIIGSSLVFTTIAYPEYFNELADAQRTVLRARGLPETEIAERVHTAMEGATPMGYALQGFLGTPVTGILASAVIALFLRGQTGVRPGSDRGKTGVRPASPPR